MSNVYTALAFVTFILFAITSIPLFSFIALCLAATAAIVAYSEHKVRPR